MKIPKDTIFAALPASLTAEQRARYPSIHAIVRRTVENLPRPGDKALEPGHVYNLHHIGLKRAD